jgi:hypothetical protein
MGVYTTDVVSPGAGAAAQVLHAQPRSGLGPGARGAGTARLVEFRRLNFMDADYGDRREGRRDLLPQRDHLLRPAHAGAHSRKLSNCLCRADTCFVGHAETLHDMNLPLAPVAPALYRRIDGRA